MNFKRLLPAFVPCVLMAQGLDPNSISLFKLPTAMVDLSTTKEKVATPKITIPKADSIMVAPRLYFLDFIVVIPSKPVLS